MLTWATCSKEECNVVFFKGLPDGMSTGRFRGNRPLMNGMENHLRAQETSKKPFSACLSSVSSHMPTLY